MKDLFPQFYYLSSNERDQLLRECLFVFDTNVLFNLYRQSEDTSKKILEILEKLSHQLWMPHQIAYEYNKGRTQRIVEQAVAYEEVGKYFQSLEEKLNEAKAQLKTNLKKYERHPSLDVNAILNRVEKTLNIESIKREVQKKKQSHPSWLSEDPILETLHRLFEGKVGHPYSEERLLEIYSDGEARYIKSQPPGFKDKDKEVPERYGDLIIWFQLIDKSKETGKPILFITEDRKKDWWNRLNGQTIGPQPELLLEMFEKAGTRFVMYQVDQFTKNVAPYYGITNVDEAVQEILELREVDRQNAILESIGQEDAGDRKQQSAIDVSGDSHVLEVNETQKPAQPLPLKPKALSNNLTDLAERIAGTRHLNEMAERIAGTRHLNEMAERIAGTQKPVGLAADLLEQARLAATTPIGFPDYLKEMAIPNAVMREQLANARRAIDLQNQAIGLGVSIQEQNAIMREYLAAVRPAVDLENQIGLAVALQDPIGASIAAKMSADAFDALRYVQSQEQIGSALGAKLAEDAHNALSASSRIGDINGTDLGAQIDTTQPSIDANEEEK